MAARPPRANAPTSLAASGQRPAASGQRPAASLLCGSPQTQKQVNGRASQCTDLPRPYARVLKYLAGTIFDRGAFAARQV
jgi:hypothetical protein